MASRLPNFGNLGRAGRDALKPSVNRPPWSRAEAEFIDNCTRCGACVESCSTGVLAEDGDGIPFVDFSKAPCTLCGTCASICPVDCFDTETGTVPWAVKASIDARCIQTGGEACRVCEETCEQRAIVAGGRHAEHLPPMINRNACTGCGGCSLACPMHAITMDKSEPPHLKT